MAIVCLSVSQLKPDAGSPSHFKGGSKSHPGAGQGSPLPAQLPVAPRPCWCAQPFPGRGSILAADLLLNIVCRLFLQLVWLFFCLQTKPPEAETTWSAPLHRYLVVPLCEEGAAEWWEQRNKGLCFPPVLERYEYLFIYLFIIYIIIDMIIYLTPKS